MPDRFVSSASAYLPLLRLDRKAAIAALSWSGLGGPRGGRRSVAGWDEDAVTMAVEAARLAIGDEPPQTVVFASTSGPSVSGCKPAFSLTLWAYQPTPTRPTSLGPAAAESQRCGMRFVIAQARC